MLNPSILILLIQLRVVGLRMLSAGQNLAVFLPKRIPNEGSDTISEDLLTPCNR